ncbi:hypothetical protein TW81_02120 [Vibrio galatheae]|uniref:Uncharacterized protein n=1 Tax=Vibrio galatheae TaxID=579748 RepID=A0A0F4NPJ0_9VIBR|nr:hypothetical protein [Vibrio galatheae]KJY84814.1 hypothetical protein TW81_02120 [Vibrio galatheae]
MRIEVIEEHGVFYAIAYDSDGKEVDRLAALTRKNARRLMKTKLGKMKKSRLKLEAVKVKPKTKDFDHRGVRSSLSGVTSSRNWKTTK